MSKPSVGLLPLYIELYDQAWPELRPRVDGSYQQIASALCARGLEVSTVPMCRVKPEFDSAVKKFAAANGICLRPKIGLEGARVPRSRSNLGHWVGAQVASLQSLILRPVRRDDNREPHRCQVPRCPASLPWIAHLFRGGM
jgi:hypothetical protein